MNLTSRTTKSLNNSMVAMTITTITIILQFFSRKVFLQYLGTDVLGLNTTVVNLLQFLNLAELGIGSATTFALYKPLSEGNKTALNEIVSLQGHLYRKIAFIIIISASILSIFFPIIFEKSPLPLWYAYASFLVMLFSSLLGYFINYRQVLLSANQEEYKIQYSYKTIMILKVIFQITFIYLFPKFGYQCWLIFEALFALIGSLSLNRIIKRNFPFLKKSTKPYKDLKIVYSEIITKIKQLFLHKIGIFVLGQTSPLIIYAYISLSMVALYGNYMMIMNGVRVIMGSLFNGVEAGVGNLIAENNINRIKSVFIELFSLRFFIVACVCFLIYHLAPNFISLWIGDEYILSNSTLAILTLTLYISLFRTTVGAFIAGYGLFQDVYAPIIEAAINISLSIILGKFYGLNGILTGVLISQVLVIAIWKPYFLFTRKLKGMGIKYILLYLKHIIQLIIVWGISIFILNKISNIIDIDGFASFIIYTLISLIVFGGFLLLSLYVTKSGIQIFIHRIYNLRK